MRPYRTMPTQKLDKGEFRNEDDAVAVETALELRLEKEFIAAFVCSPGFEKELALGYLIDSGILRSGDEIHSIKCAGNVCTVMPKEGSPIESHVRPVHVRRVVTTECSAPEILQQLRTASGIPRLEAHLSVPTSRLFEAVKLIRESQEIRKKTGATHAAFLMDMSNDKHSIVEDLGRHTAADKCIGMAVKSGYDLESSFMLTTGRLTADIVSKCAWASIPLLASAAVATDAAIKFAQRGNVTLVGSLRGQGMRVYHEGAASLLV
ncbi:MAG: formate dehydrogenase accessory sulfurtransferase FdhD [Candidatus Thorarchaeota archaeon]|nr:MAG: formate dehydrogenase accessory sulfurtransferase FdhD [Candidatus Thorarchaeota archaeon]